MDIGVVIPAFNGERYLAAALESVLEQTLPPRRVVVVDDGSTDGTVEVAGRFGKAVTCVRQANRGMAATRNRGAQEAGTEWLAFLDQDDIWLQTKLERQQKCIAATHLEVAFTAVRVVDSELNPIAERGTQEVRTDLEALLFRDQSMPQSTPSSMLIKSSLFRAAGGFDEELGMSADWDLLVRLRLRTEFAYVPEPLVLYRRHDSNQSRKVAILERESIRVLEKSFALGYLPSDVGRLRRRCLAWNDAVLSGSHFWAGSWARAVWFAARAVWRDPSLIGRVVGFPTRQLVRLWRNEPRPGSL